MGNGFTDAALAIFTTLAPMAAVSFIALAYTFISGKPDAETTKRLDRWTTVLAVVLIAGFVGAFMHIATPGHAFRVLTGLGRSPLSNEIFTGIIFAVVALIYWIWALTGKLSNMVRKVFLVILSVLALIFTIFCGLAYMINTIPTWNTPMSIVQMFGYALVGGTVLGFTVVGLARVQFTHNAAVVAFVLALLGVVIGAIGFGVQIGGLAGIRNIWGFATQLVPMIWLLFAIFVVLGVIAAILTYIGGKKAFSPKFMIIASVIVAVGIFFARIGFYGLFMGIAL